MRREIITADNVGMAVEKIFDKLKITDPSHVIYFDGWEGLGASAVIRAVAQYLTSGKIMDPELKFENIIHVDCSMWKSRREMQRKIAEELDITKAMYIFDKQDEDDDFNGINESSRDVITEIAAAINDNLMTKRFLVVFHNGGDNEMNGTDATTYGLPLYQQFKGNKMLWTFRGRFRLSSKIQDNVQSADTLLLCAMFHVKTDGKGFYQEPKNWWYILCEEAAEVASSITFPGVAKLNPTTIALCWLYISKLNCVGRDIIDYNWTVHASNYWVCDGIIQDWETADALHQKMWQEYDDPGLHYLMGKTDQWISTAQWNSSNNGFQPFSTVDQTVSSFFLSVDQIVTDGEDQLTKLLQEYFCLSKISSANLLQHYNDMFQHADSLRVLKLSLCTFRFASPPFLRCRTLRFLGLDQCQDCNKDAGEEAQSWICFRGLWVLDLNCTQWVFSQQMINEMDNVREFNVRGISPYNLNNVWRWETNNIRKLRVIKTIDQHSEATKDANSQLTSFSFSHMENMEILDLSGNIGMQAFPDLSKATCLKTITVDDCVGLQSVTASNLPALLEAFSLVASEQYPKGANITTISLCGCSRLIKLILSGLPKLEELDLCGTKVEKVDLHIIKAEKLKRLFLLGCLNLRSIQWSEVWQQQLDELHVDTVGLHLDGCQPRHNLSLVLDVDDKLFHSHIVVIDPRLLQSLQLFARQCHYVHFCISSSVDYSNGGGASKENVVMQCSSEQSLNGHVHRKLPGNIYVNIIDHVVALGKTFVCPDLPLQPKHQGSCKVQMISRNRLQGSDNNLGSFVDIVDSLHVHDDFWTTTVPGSNWGWVKWCRIERCPMLHSVFEHKHHGHPIAFSWLDTLWASDLQTARYIWNIRSKPIHADSFKKLRFIHLEACPRLIHILPFSNELPSLETIRILYCTSLVHVFPLNITNPHPLNEEIATDTINFPELKHIHLHELPMMQQMCEGKTMLAPKLENIEIRGCWNLRHLPDVTGFQGPKPIVDCEKDWWDNLASHHQGDGCNPSSLYELRSPQCYKRSLPKGSALR